MSVGVAGLDLQNYPNLHYKLPTAHKMNTEKTSLQFQNSNAQMMAVPAGFIKQEMVSEDDCCDKENNANFAMLSYENIEIDEFNIKDEITYSSNDSEFLDQAFSSHVNSAKCLGENSDMPSMKYVNSTTDTIIKHETQQSVYRDSAVSRNSSSSLKEHRRLKRATRGCRKRKRDSGNPAVTRLKKKRLLQCDHCSYATPRKDRMFRHMLTHSHLFPYIPKNLQTEKRFIHCQDCKFTTCRKDSMARHVLTHVKLFPHACSACNFRCNEAYGLKRHQAIRHGSAVLKEIKQKKSAPILICEVCGFESHFFWKFKVHMKTHESHHPRKNCELCPFSSYSSEGMRRHVRRCPVGAPPRLLSCPSCAYSTAESRHLQRHCKTHLGSAINSLQCAVCGEYFNSKSLKFHQKERCKGRRSE